MKPDLKAIAERAEKATAGPWTSGLEIKHNCKDLLDFPIATLTHRKNLNTAIDDADFIAHARTDIPELLDYIAELEAVTDASRALKTAIREYDAAVCKDLPEDKYEFTLRACEFNLYTALAKLDGDKK